MTPCPEEQAHRRPRLRVCGKSARCVEPRFSSKARAPSLAGFVCLVCLLHCFFWSLVSSLSALKSS